MLYSRTCDSLPLSLHTHDLIQWMQRHWREETESYYSLRSDTEPIREKSEFESQRSHSKDKKKSRRGREALTRWEVGKQLDNSDDDAYVELIEQEKPKRP